MSQKRWIQMFAVAGLVVGLAMTPAMAAKLYKIDDGTGSDGIGLVIGGGLWWLNQFNVIEDDSPNVRGRALYLICMDYLERENGG